MDEKFPNNTTITAESSTIDQRSAFAKSQWTNYGKPDKVLETPLPLNVLCSACFGKEPAPRFAVICFDACMQQKNLGRTKYTRIDECRDKRLFIDAADGTEIPKTVILQFPKFVNSRLQKK